MINLRLLKATLLSLVLFSFSAFSQEETTLEISDITCPSSNIIGTALITDVCWEGMFPIYIGNMRVKGPSQYTPSDASDRNFCLCDGDLSNGILPQFGARLGFFLPKYLLTVTKKPYCFPELNGAELASQLGLVSRFNVGNEDMSQSEGDGITNQSSYSWHLASLPLLSILELFDLKSCNADGYINFDMLWISETLPHWYDPELAYYIAPESKLFSNPLALAGVVADCVASTFSQPVDSIFFAAGCWGNMYPLTAHTGSNPDKVSSKSLVAARALFFLSRIGVLERTMGNDALCKAKKMPILKKSQYRIQQLWPMSESESTDILCENDEACDSTTMSSTLGPERVGESPNANNIEQIEMNSLNETCTHPIGQSTFRWGMWRGAKQEDHASYLIFQWNDCCMDAVDPFF